MKHTISALILRAVPASLLLVAPLAATAQAIEEIVVTADFRGRPASEIPASVTVLAADEVAQLALQHFEELINVVPNLNWSGDGHRARYLQIRGVGELEQYQGAPNPSVGFLIDDIDFSGIGTIATTFDIERIEVLRGPQGTRYGANALAGLVYVQSAMPTAEREGRLQLTAGDDDTLAGGVAFGGPLAAGDSLSYRLSAHHHESNGFRDNAYLGRDDTNGRDETTVRGRVRWLPADTLSVDFAALFADIQNGYDAFAIDNSLTMLSACLPWQSEHAGTPGSVPLVGSVPAAGIEGPRGLRPGCLMHPPFAHSCRVGLPENWAQDRSCSPGSASGNIFQAS